MARGKTRHFVYVCATCDHDAARRDSAEARDGKALLAAVRQAVQADPDFENVTVKSVKCMGGCERPCSVGFTAEGKQACLFVGMAAERVGEVLAVLRAHMASPIGRVRTRGVLAELADRYLCRIPQAREG